MKNIWQLPSINSKSSFRFLQPERDYADCYCFCGRLQSDSVLEMRESCHADVGNQSTATIACNNALAMNRSW